MYSLQPLSSGLKGDKGLKGDQGSKGDMGFQGNQGTKGNKGDKGDNSTGLNYIFAYDTTTQTIATPEVFQDITVNTVANSNGWSHINGSPHFIPTTSGTYKIISTVIIFNSSAVPLEYVTTFRGVVNGNEILASQSVQQVGALINQSYQLTSSFVVDLIQNDVLKMQFSSSSVLTSAISGLGSGIIKPSFSICITKI